MLGLIGWVILAFYPRYWLAGILAVIFAALNVSLAERFREFSPGLADSYLSDAEVLTITFAVFAFGIVFVRKMVSEMKAKTNLQLMAILERARAKAERPPE